mgnify:FL=1
MENARTKNSFTPGPWTPEEAAAPIQTIYRWRVNELATGKHFIIAGLALSGDSRIDEANACLIAAAPELLEALEAACRLDYFNEHNALASQARAAIAKAKGE